MKGKTTKKFATILIMSLLVVSIVYAAQGPSEDTYIDSANPSTVTGGDAASLSVFSQNLGSGCEQVNIAIVKFDLSGISSSIGDTSTLTFTISLNQATSGDLVLYRFGDGWNEGTATWGNSSTLLGTEISRVTLTGAESSFQFTGSALASFLDTEKGGDASLALGIEGCSGFPFFLTDSSEGTSSPSLALFSPTAVELTTVQAESSSIDFSTPMIYTVLVILAVFSAWFVFKRRTN